MSNAPHRDSEMKTMLGIPLTTWAAANGPVVRRDLGLEPMKEAKMSDKDYRLELGYQRDARLNKATLEDGYARQGASGDGKVRRHAYEDDPNTGGSIGTVIEGKRRPMTEAEERLMERALDWNSCREKESALGPEARAKLDLVRSAARAVTTERQPLRPITAEELAVIEAAKGFAEWNAVTAMRGIEPLPTLQKLLDAVRRLK